MWIYRPSISNPFHWLNLLLPWKWVYWDVDLLFKQNLVNHQINQNLLLSLFHEVLLADRSRLSNHRLAEAIALDQYQFDLIPTSSSFLLIFPALSFLLLMVMIKILAHCFHHNQLYQNFLQFASIPSDRWRASSTHLSYPPRSLNFTS